MTNSYRPDPDRPATWTWWEALVERAIHLRMRALRTFFVLVTLGSMSVAVQLVSGCGDAALQIQAQTANAVAQAANAGLPLLVERFRRQGFTALEGVKAHGGTEQEARAAIAEVEAEWAPIWKAWDTLRIAQDKWATVIETGSDPVAALAELKDAYCELQRVWPEGLPAVPLAPLRCPSE